MVDRIACTWLIRRFIDPAARFVFVSGKDYTPRPGELRFDMFDAEIVHDIDLKDGKFGRPAGRPDADGVARAISALALSAADDDERVARGGALFEDLHKLYGRQ
ncbi:MAG TPA: chromate resistance protein ChrB domain-containing protein [Kofleriaceae bacterium]|nr:chromate resistance protein ChrB domain-containing protein [Kofleriaceae bacterium]